MFFGREKELAYLCEKLNNNRFESILIYGRRRIGKSRLIAEAVKNLNYKVISYECKKSLEIDNLIGLNELVCDIFNVDITFNSIKALLEYVFKESIKEKIAIVIDELPFLLNENPVISSDLRDLIGKYSDNSKLKLILSGSYVDTMKHLNDGNSETYGRFTGIINLKPFDYYDSAKFYPNYSNEDKILMYSIFGGVAFFNSLIDSELSPYENIKKLILEPNSILQLEVENTVEAETNKIPFLNSTFLLISQGVNRYSDIKSKLSYKYGSNVNPDYLLKKLIEMDLVEILTPINDSQNNKKKRYYIKDNLILFYYRYIFYKKSQNSNMNPDQFFNYFVKDDLYKTYLPKRFESISKEFLIRRNKNDLIYPPFFEIGSYSYDDSKNKLNREFDIVTLDDDGYIAYECKFTSSKIDLNVVKEELNQTSDIEIMFYKLGFISKTGFSDDVNTNRYICYKLDDFYE